MSLIVFDSCTRYGPGYDLAYAYTVFGTINANENGLGISANAGFYNRSVISSFDTIRGGLRLIYPTTSVNGMTLFRVLSGTTVIGRLDVTSDGLLSWYNHATSTSSTYLKAQATVAMSKGIEQTLDIYVRLATTAVGWVNIKAGTRTLINVSNIITATAATGNGYNPCYLGTASDVLQLRGFHVSTASNAVIPSMGSAWTIERLTPIAVGSATSFYANPNSLENWDCVNDTGFSADNDYLSAASPCNELFTVAHATVPGSTIAGLMVTGLATEESTARTYKLQLASDGNTELSGSFSGFTDYQYRQDSYLSITDPATSSAWLASAVNIAEYGFQLIS